MHVAEIRCVRLPFQATEDLVDLPVMAGRLADQVDDLGELVRRHLPVGGVLELVRRVAPQDPGHATAPLRRRRGRGAGDRVGVDADLAGDGLDLLQRKTFRASGKPAAFRALLQLDGSSEDDGKLFLRVGALPWIVAHRWLYSDAVDRWLDSESLLLEVLVEPQRASHANRRMMANLLQSTRLRVRRPAASTAWTALRWSSSLTHVRIIASGSGQMPA